MSDKKPVTKLSKMSFSRIAICANPADQDAMHVLVKSEDIPVETDAPATLDAAAISKMINEAVAEAISKVNAPIVTSMAGDVSGTQSPDDDGGKAAIQECMKTLVKACNESKTTPKDIKAQIAKVAKFHGIEGPDIVDDGTSGKFEEAIASINAVAGVLQQAVTQMVGIVQQPAATATKKSVDDAPVVVEEPVKPVAAPAELLKEHSETSKLAKAAINELRKMMGKEPIQ